MQQKFNACLDAAIDSPEAGAKWAEQWRIAGGGYLARQCLGFAYAEQKRWLPAMTAFQQAADEADIARDPTSGQLWAQAGNAARSEEHTSELQSLMRISYAVLCLKKKNTVNKHNLHQ